MKRRGSFVQRIDNDSGNVNSVALVFCMSLILPRHISAGLLTILVALPGIAADKIDFTLDVKPLLESTCLSCHDSEKPKGELELTTRALAIKGGEKGAGIVPGKPADSRVYTSTVLPAG